MTTLPSSDSSFQLGNVTTMLQSSSSQTGSLNMTLSAMYSNDLSAFLDVRFTLWMQMLPNLQQLRHARAKISEEC